MRKYTKARFRQILSSSMLEDEEKTRRARLLNAIVWTFFVITLSGGLALFTIQGFGVRLSMAVAILVGLGAVYTLMRRGHIQVASLALVMLLSLTTTITIYRLGGLRFPGVSFYILITLIAGLLLEVWLGLTILSLLILAVLGLYYAEWAGFITYTIANEPLPVVLAITTLILAFTAVLMYLYTNQVKQAMEYARRNERALKENNLTLQQEIAERRQAEEAVQKANTELQQTQALLRSLIDNVPAAIMVRDKTGCYNLANRQAATWSGYTVEHIVGRQPHELFSLEVRGEPKPVTPDAPPMQRQVVWPGPDKTRLCHQYRFPIFDNAGSFYGVCIFILDITEQKQAEEALRNNEAYLRAIINNIPFDLWVCDAEGRYIIQNAISLDLASDLTGKTVDDLDIPPEARVEYKQKHLRAISGHIVREEIEAIVKGQPRILDSVQYPIQEGENTLGFIGMQIDITEHKQTELALRRRAEEMTALYETSLEINAELDLATLLPAIIRRAATLLGVEMGALHLIKPDLETLEIVAVYNRPVSEMGITAKVGQGMAGHVVQTGEPLMISNYRHWPERTTHFANEQIGRILGVPIKQNQQAIGVLNVFDPHPGEFNKNDIQLLSLFAAYAAITIQNARLLEAEQHHREIAETLSEIARVTNASLDLKEVLNRALLGLEKILSFEVGVISLVEGDSFRTVATTESTQQNPVGAILPMTKLRFIHHVYQTARPQLVPDTHQIEHFSPANDEAALVRSLIGIPLISQEKVIAVVTIGSYTPNQFTEKDAQIAFRFAQQVAMAINNARLYQQIQRYNQELEDMVTARTRELETAQEKLIRQEKLAFLGQLAGGVGHELRNPLGVITNAVYFLQMVLPEADETVKEYLDLIANRVGEADRIVNGLLNLSRNRTADRTEIAAVELVNEVLARHPAPERIKAAVNIPPDLPHLFVDSQQIKQVLTNLVTNAYQAMPRGGQLTISAHSEEEWVNLSMTDTGVGMSPETMEKIFEPLFTTKAKGIGLGLAVSKNLVEVNGGKIEVESAEGQGTVFFISLPAGGDEQSRKDAPQ